MKCYAGGPQDLLDARSAYEAAPGPIDLDLLRTVTRRFGGEAADRLQEVLAGSLALHNDRELAESAPVVEP
jgi:hypothetical protein